MTSVTQRIREIKQPYGGYVPAKNLKLTQLADHQTLNPKENISSALVGLAVDYLTRFMLTKDAKAAFDIAFIGARNMWLFTGRKMYLEKFFHLISEITQLDDQAIINACQLSGFDAAYRVGPMAYRPIETIQPDKATIANIKIMVERSLHFFQQFCPAVETGFTLKGGYTDIVSTGDGDFLTKDTLWDFKVSKAKPNSKQTLQLLMYYIMGKHSTNSNFKEITKLGIFNPRQNTVYQIAVSEIKASVIKEVSTQVIGYKN